MAGSSIDDWHRVEEEWPPRELRFKAALRRGAGHLQGGEQFAAYRAFAEASAGAVGEDRELARGLVHLAAASYKRRLRDERGCARQLEHARRRLGPFLPTARGIDIASLLDRVES